MDLDQYSRSMYQQTIRNIKGNMNMNSKRHILGFTLVIQGLYGLMKVTAHRSELFRDKLREMDIGITMTIAGIPMYRVTKRSRFVSF